MEADSKKPAAPAKKDAAPASAPAVPSLVGRELLMVQFHTGVGLGPLGVTTGVNVPHLAKRGQKVHLHLVGPGVLITTEGRTFMAPFSNVLNTEFKEAV